MIEELCKQAGITYFEISCDLEDALPFEIERLYYKHPAHDSTDQYSFFSDEEGEDGELLPLRFATYVDAIAEIEKFAKQKIEGNKRRAGLPWYDEATSPSQSPGNTQSALEDT